MLGAATVTIVYTKDAWGWIGSSSFGASSIEREGRGEGESKGLGCLVQREYDDSRIGSYQVASKSTLIEMSFV